MARGRREIDLRNDRFLLTAGQLARLADKYAKTPHFGVNPAMPKASLKNHYAASQIHRIDSHTYTALPGAAG
jgi:hypothetical protein